MHLFRHLTSTTVRRASISLGLLVAAWGATATAAELLADRGSSDYEIVCPHPENKVAQLAARELQHLIARATEARLPITAEPHADRKHLFVGASRFSKQAGIVATDLRPAGFHLQTVGADLHIVGDDSGGNLEQITPSHPVRCGTLNGAYEFLERVVGVMFCWDSELGTIVPPQPQLALPALNITDAPAWSYRILAYGPDATRGLYGLRLRLGSNSSTSFEHAWFKILPAEKYGRQHPEYFAEIDGVRRPAYYQGRHGGQVCTTNPEVIEIFARTALDFFRQNPEREMFSISPNDGAGFCECARCRALDVQTFAPARPDSPVLTDRILTFYNAVAERVAPAAPDKLLGGYIYADYSPPPVRTRPHPNLVLVQASDSALEHGRRWPQERDWERQWGGLSPRMLKYDIAYLGEPALNLIAPVTKTLEEKIRSEDQAGFQGGSFYIGRTYEQLGAGHFLLAKLMWNPQADVAELERRYYAALYGPAAADVQAYYNLLENRLRQVYRQGIDVAEPAIQAAELHLSEMGSVACTLAAYWPILNDADQLLQRARTRELSSAEKRRLARLEEQHALLLSTVASVILAGRLDEQAQFNPTDVAGWAAATQQRESVRQKLNQEGTPLAPVYFLEDPNRNGLAAVPIRTTAFAALQHLPRVQPAIRAKDPPQIDGRAGDLVWRQAIYRPLLRNGTGRYSTQGGRAAAAFDERNLYVHFEGRGPRDEQIADRVELLLSPPGGEDVYRIVLRADGTLWSGIHAANTEGDAIRPWNSQALGKFETSRTGWSAELALPFAALPTPRAAGEWRINLFRIRREGAAGDDFLATYPTFGSQLDVALFARLQFGNHGDEPGFTVGNLDDIPPAEAARRLRFNPTGDAALTMTSAMAYSGHQSILVRVGAGGSGALTLTAPVTPQVLYRTSLAYWARQVAPEARGGVGIRIIFRDEHNQPVTESNGYLRKTLPPTADVGVWKVPLTTFVTPPRATQISLTLSCGSPGDFGFDDFALEQIGPCETQPPAPPQP